VKPMKSGTSKWEIIVILAVVVLFVAISMGYVEINGQ